MSSFSRIQPIVLVGGRSTRFGRDKLREPLGGSASLVRQEILVDRPIAALRDVFGDRVAVVGECHPTVAARADRVIDDKHPGVGPIGGIVSALEICRCDVFVLAGDLLRIAGAVVRAVCNAAEQVQDAIAVLAVTDRLEPCVGIYCSAALPVLREHLTQGRYSLHQALHGQQVATVPLEHRALFNVNTPQAMAGNRLDRAI